MSFYRGSLCLSIFLSVSCQTKPVARKPWLAAEEVGVLAKKDGQVCLQIRNPSVKADSPIRILNLAPPQTALVGRIEAKGDACSGADSSDGQLFGYKVFSEGAVQMPAIGILDYTGDFQKQGDGLAADLDGDGQLEYFRACPSSEGIHFTIWTEKPLSGKLRWHQYYSLGYDISASCTAEETGSPK
jgi:hypothetical protein